MVYWASVEFDILNPEEYENCVGGFVYLFLKAGDVLDAVEKIQTAVKAENFAIQAIEFVSPYDEVPWESQADQQLYDSLAKEAEQSDEVIWDELAAYESRED